MVSDAGGVMRVPTTDIGNGRVGDLRDVFHHRGVVKEVRRERGDGKTLVLLVWAV